MADITMCLNDTCPMKDKCYRYTAPVSPHRQSYADFQPKEVRPGDSVCEHFADNGRRVEKCHGIT